MITILKKLALPVLMASWLATPATTVAAEAYPAKAVRLIVPYAPGGGTDTMARALAQKLGEIWQQKVIVENKPGASESIAASSVARSAADGYTLLFASDSTFQLNPVLYKNLSYDPDKDLLPIVRFASSPFALFVSADTGIDSFDAFIRHAKANRGQTFYGSYGVANSTNLGLAWLSQQFDLGMVHVPFAGQSPAMVALLGGEIQTLFGNVIPSSVGFIEKGRVKVLAVSGQQRLSSAPDVPTFRELGYDNLDTQYTLGLAAPAGTPEAVQRQIFEAVKQAVADPELAGNADRTFSIQVFAEDAAQYRAFIEQSRQTMRERMQAAKLEKLDQ